MDDLEARPAVFLDRDGTIIEAVHYLSRPEDVRLIRGAASAIADLRGRGYACVVVTNQSAIGRGIMTDEQYRRVAARVDALLAEYGARLDATYYCPRAPATTDRTRVEDDDRKPGAGMLRCAARELNLDLPRSWMVGDMISDLLAGLNAGCRGVVAVASGPEPVALTSLPESAPAFAARDLPEASRLIIDQAARQP